MITAPALILVTGATGKVGQTFLRRFHADPAFAHFKLPSPCVITVEHPRAGEGGSRARQPLGAWDAYLHGRAGGLRQDGRVSAQDARPALSRNPNPMLFELVGQHEGQVPTRLASRLCLARLIEEAWTYQRAADDPRKVRYPG